MTASSYGKIRPTLARLDIDLGQSNIYSDHAIH
jgi:hypothetical protein